MKILLVPSWYATEDRPLCGVFFREQALALIAAGHAVRIIYPDLRFRLGGLPRGLYRTPDAEVPTWILRRRTLTPMLERGRRPQLTGMLKRLYGAATEDWGRPDIVHLHSCRMGIETLHLCRRQGLPLICTEHYTGVARDMPAALREELARTLAGCSRAIAVSQALRRRMLPFRPDILTVPNLIDTGAFDLAVPPEQLPEFVFAAVGNLIPRKGFGSLIRAFALAVSDMPGARLVIAGEGPERWRLSLLADSLGVGGRVTLCGAVERDRMPAFYNDCSCLVCSSEYETFGMTLIEALACGRPLISTRCGGPEGIVGPENGLLVPPGDERALAQAMRQMFQNRGGYPARRLRAEAERLYSAGAVAARLTGIYQEVISEAAQK